MKDSGRKVSQRLVDRLFEALGGVAPQVTIGPQQEGSRERWIAFWDTAGGSWMRAEITADVDVDTDLAVVVERVEDSGIEMHGEGGVMSRQVVGVEGPRFRIVAGRKMGKTTAAEAMEAFAREYPELDDVAMRQARKRYELRAASNSTFFLPVDHPFGLGHCRSCHHDCRFEWHQMVDDELTTNCQEPTCGHDAGCPSC